MAARENQGLQIALIVFVMLTIMLSVTTFIFFRNYQYEQRRVADEQNKATEAAKRMAELQGERDDFVKYIGFPASEKKQTVDEAWTKDLAEAETLGIAQLPEDQKNYRKIVDALEGVVRAQSTQLSKKDTDLREAKATFDQKQAEFEAEKKKLADEKAAAVQDYLDERQRMNQEVTALTQTKNQLTAEKVEKDKALEGLKAQSQTQVAGLEKDLAGAQALVAKRGQEISELSGEFSVNAMPDGKVVWVNNRENAVYINLGSADLLRKRITFTVFDAGTTDVSALNPESPAVAKAIKKGSIEVVNVSDPHMAECRILEHSTSNPILPGDLIYTPVWRPGQQDHVALAGFHDLDNDGLSDRARVRDLIRLHGGIIDAETDDKGNVIGGITGNTRFLVVGTIGAREGVNQAGDSQLLADGAKYGVETVELDKFMEMLGYTNLAGLNQPASAGPVPEAPAPGEPIPAFRPRLPPSRGRSGGGY